MRKSALMHTTKRLASLKLTFAAMVLLGVGVLLKYRGFIDSGLLVDVPLVLLTINLVAALLTNARLRGSPSLFMFHVSLLALLGLILVDENFSLHARVELSEGQAFDPDLVVITRKGTWYRDSLDSIRFIQGDISVNYAPGMIRGDTRSHVTLPENHSNRSPIVGDDTPLSIGGYKLYTTHNKGYAAVLGLQPETGEKVKGAVHFPSYPRYEWKQTNTWRSAQSGEITLELVLSDRPPENTGWEFNSRAVDADIALTINGTRTLLEPGGSLQAGSEVISFEQIRGWMGYRISYNPVLPWMFMTSILSVLFLGWHLWVKLFGWQISWERHQIHGKGSAGIS